MANNLKPQNSRNVFQHQPHPSNLKRPLGGVRQDKRAFLRARTASQQPARYKELLRAQQMESNTARSQNNNTTKRKTVQLTLWVKPIVKAELGRIAEQEGLTVSAAGAVLIERALQQNIDMQYGALLEPIIERCIDRKMEGMTTKLAWLLVRVAFDVGQMRGMTTNILGRQPGMNQDILTTILKESSNTAKANITRKTPQLKELMNLIEKWLHENEKGRG